MLADDGGSATAPVGNKAEQKPGWLFVLPWPLLESGGVNHVVKSLIRCFADTNEFSTYVLVTTRQEELDYDLGSPVTSQFSLDIWPPIDFSHPLKALISFLYRFPWRYITLRRIVSRNNIKIINPHFPSLNAIMFLALKMLGHVEARIVLSFHGSDVQSLLSTSGFARLLWKNVLRRVDGITVVSKSLGSELLALEPRIAGKLVTIYNGVDLEVFAAFDSSQKPLSPKSHQVATIISIGAFREIKGHDVLVQAFALIAKRIPNTRLMLVGNQGPALNQIRNLIETMHLNGRIVVETDVSHERIPSLLASAQLFVLASRREGFPLVLVEAAAAKVPIVCTKAGGMSELIIDGVTGRLVEIDDAHALHDAIIDLLRDPVTAERLAANCFEYVKDNLTWRQAYDKYLRLSHETERGES
jgi:glycosyltransferase involved in cell wall biosynthesis